MGDQANKDASERASVRGCKGQHGEYGAIGTITLQRPAWEVYHFLTRVESQPSWNNAVKRAEVVKTTKVAEHVEVKHVQQVMGWGFLALRGNFTMNLCMREDARAMEVHTEMASHPSSNGSQPGSPVSSRSSSFSERSSDSGSPRSGGSSSPSSEAPANGVDSPASDDGGSNTGRGGFMKRFSSRMTVSELTANSALLEMQMFMLPSIYVPFGVRSLVGGQVRRQLGGVLQSVKAHVESPGFKPSGTGSSSLEEEQQKGSNTPGRAVFAPAALTLAV